MTNPTQETEIRERLGKARRYVDDLFEWPDGGSIRSSLNDIPHLLTLIEGLRGELKHAAKIEAAAREYLRLLNRGYFEVQIAGARIKLDKALADLPKGGE